MELFSKASFTNLEKALGYSAMKQQVISQNIANVDTPFYKAKRVTGFSTALEKAIIEARRTDERHIPFKGQNSNTNRIRQQNTNFNHNGNNVDMDLEMAEMAKNQIYYNVLVERMNGKFNSMKDVLKGGS